MPTISVPLRLDPTKVAARFDRIAPIYPFFEWLFRVPQELRQRSVDLMGLHPGDRAISVGCGQGKSLPLLANAVGENGRVIGVDLSRGMLRRALRRCRDRGLRNVELVHSDINAHHSRIPWDAVLFSFSLTTFGDPRTVLLHSWKQLRPGGKLVVLDGQLPSSIPQWILRPCMPLIRTFLEATVLGDPDMPTLDVLRVLGAEVDVERTRSGTYFIARITKPGL